MGTAGTAFGLVMERCAERRLQKVDHRLQFTRHQIGGDGVKTGAGYFANHQVTLPPCFK